jgi:hypothetical protein
MNHLDLQIEQVPGMHQPVSPKKHEGEKDANHPGNDKEFRDLSHEDGHSRTYFAYPAISFSYSLKCL